MTAWQMLDGDQILSSQKDVHLIWPAILHVEVNIFLDYLPRNWVNYQLSPWFYFGMCTYSYAITQCNEKHRKKPNYSAMSGAGKQS